MQLVRRFCDQTRVADAHFLVLDVELHVIPLLSISFVDFSLICCRLGNGARERDGVTSLKGG